MKIKNLVLSLFVVILVTATGCIEYQKQPFTKETITAIPSVTEQKLPAYNETQQLEINIPFETWSRGYDAKDYLLHPHFEVITNYSDWIRFLNNQGPLEGQLFPGLGIAPKTIGPVDFNDDFIITAMMGKRGKRGPEIEILNISRINNVVRIIINKYDPGYGESVESAPYHIVLIKKELVPDNSAINIIDTDAKFQAGITKGDYRILPSLIETISDEFSIPRDDDGVKEIVENYYFGDFFWDCSPRPCKGNELYLYMTGYPKRWEGEKSIVITLQNAYTENEKLKKIEITTEKATPVSFKTVAVGESSGYTSPALMVINNMSEWADVWQKHSSYLVDQKPQVPGINFSNETVVAVFLGESPAFDAGIMDITRAERNVFVNLQKRYPPSRSSGEPYFIVRLSKTWDNIIFRTLRWEYS